MTLLDGLIGTALLERLEHRAAGSRAPYFPLPSARGCGRVMSCSRGSLRSSRRLKAKLIAHL